MICDGIWQFDMKGVDIVVDRFHKPRVKEMNFNLFYEMRNLFIKVHG